MTALEAAIIALLSAEPDYIRGFCDALRVSNEQMWNLAKAKGEVEEDYVPPPFTPLFVLYRTDETEVRLNCETLKVSP